MECVPTENTVAAKICRQRRLGHNQNSGEKSGRHRPLFFLGWPLLGWSLARVHGLGSVASLLTSMIRRDIVRRILYK
jgi:hypothetical protein